MALKKYENYGLIQLLTDVGFTTEEIRAAIAKLIVIKDNVWIV